MAEKVKKAKGTAAPQKVGKAKATAAVNGKAKPKAGVVKTKAVTHEEIERLAYRFWAERGHQLGEPETDWFRAEQELRGRAS